MAEFILNIPNNANELLLEDIKAFAKESGLTFRTIGRRAVDHQDLEGHLLGGKTITLTRASKIYEFMNNFNKDTNHG